MEGSHLSHKMAAGNAEGLHIFVRKKNSPHCVIAAKVLGLNNMFNSASGWDMALTLHFQMKQHRCMRDRIFKQHETNTDKTYDSPGVCWGIQDSTTAEC